MNPIKVLLVIEVPLIGNIFASVLNDEPDIKVVSCAASLQDALEFTRQQEVNVVLVNVGLPDRGALTLVRMMADRTSTIKVLVLGLYKENQDDALRYIEAGAAGYILKDSSLTEFIEVIRL